MIAITGIVATMPYIALQLIGIEAVLKAMGVTGHLPIIIAFACSPPTRTSRACARRR